MDELDAAGLHSIFTELPAKIGFDTVLGKYLSPTH
jgi:hypothetical protein